MTFMPDKLNEYSVQELEMLLEAEKAKEDDAYQKFCHCVASRGANYVSIFSQACRNQNAIKEELKRRKGRL